MEQHKGQHMSIYANVLIEQHRSSDQRFRISLPESALDTTGLFEGVAVRPDSFTSIEGSEHFHRLLKRRIASVAADELSNHPAFKWIQEQGGRTVVCLFAEKSKGDNVQVVRLKHGQPAPQIINRHYRAGISVTFKERDKAMLFKLRWMGHA